MDRQVNPCCPIRSQDDLLLSSVFIHAYTDPSLHIRSSLTAQSNLYLVLY